MRNKRKPEYEKLPGESHLAHTMRVARLKAERRNKADPLVPTEAQRHGLYKQDDVMHVETATRAATLVNKGGDAVDRWVSTGKLTLTQQAVIQLMRRLWTLAGLNQRVTALYGERLPVSSGVEHRALNEIEARQDLHRIRGYFPGPLGAYFNTFENVCRHGMAAGVAGGDGCTRENVTRAHTIVCLVADVIAERERI